MKRRVVGGAAGRRVTQRGGWLVARPGSGTRGCWGEGPARKLAGVRGGLATHRGSSGRRGCGSTARQDDEATREGAVGRVSPADGA